MADSGTMGSNGTSATGSRANSNHNFTSSCPILHRFTPATHTGGGTHLHTGLNLGPNATGSGAPRETLFSLPAPSSSLGLGATGAPRGHSGSGSAGSLPSLRPLPPLGSQRQGGRGGLGVGGLGRIQSLSDDEDDSAVGSTGPGAPAGQSVTGSSSTTTTELASLRRRIAELEALNSLATAALNPAMQERINAVAVASSLQKSSKAVVLPNIVPGHTASPLDIREYSPFITLSFLFSWIGSPGLGCLHAMQPIAHPILSAKISPAVPHTMPGTAHAGD